ncbi:hypothetical protein [Microbacterium sp. KNMS]
MAARNEQETTVTLGRDDEYAYIWTNNPVHARKLDADKRVTRITANGDEFGGQYQVLAADFDPLKGFRRRGRELTPEQKAEAAARLAQARAAKNEENN